ncbi:MAG: hypothetical protein N3A38_16720, partial [Planctomycetota bacterium]|nr:hypothetical protein [Planctomycetota bacterium]
LRLDADRLFATDICRVLGIGGRFGGTVRTELSARTFEGGGGAARAGAAVGGSDGGTAGPAGRSIRVEAAIRAENARVEIEGKHQPVEARAEARADILLDGTGNPSAVLGSATVESGPLRVTTVEPFRVEGPAGAAEKAPAASGRIAFALDGERLWREFGPVLEVFGLRELREAITGEASLAAATDGTISLKATARSERQKGTSPPLTVSFSASAKTGGGDRVTASFDCRAAAGAAGDFELSATGNAASGPDGSRIELTGATFRTRMPAAREMLRRFESICAGLPKAEDLPPDGEIDISARTIFNVPAPAAGGAAPAGRVSGMPEISGTADVSIRGLRYAPPPKPGKTAVAYEVGALTLKEVGLKSTGKDGLFELRLAAEGDISWRPAAAGRDPQPDFLLRGLWKTADDAPLLLIPGSVLGGERGALQVSGALILDGADIRYVELPPYVYIKPAGVPCR